jgi:hypothetical protein
VGKSAEGRQKARTQAPTARQILPVNAHARLFPGPDCATNCLQDKELNGVHLQHPALEDSHSLGVLSSRNRHGHDLELLVRWQLCHAWRPCQEGYGLGGV